MMDVVFSAKAEADLDAIALFIARDNPARAFSFVDELTEAAINRGLFPQSGRHRSDVREGLYTFPYGHYIIVYSIFEGHVLINRIIHSARDINRLLKQADDID